MFQTSSKPKENRLHNTAFICAVRRVAALPCIESWCWNQTSGHSLSLHSCNCRPATPAPGVCISLRSSSPPRRQMSHSWCLAGCYSPAPQMSAWTKCRWDVVAGVLLSSSEGMDENKTEIIKQSILSFSALTSGSSPGNSVVTAASHGYELLFSFWS